MIKKKMEQLCEGKIITAVMAVVILSIGVIKIAPIFITSLGMAQKLQRSGMRSWEADCKTAVCLTVMFFMIFIGVQGILYIYKGVTTKREPWNQKLFEEDRNKRILVKFLFEEIEDGCPVPQEEELWALLLDMSAKQLAEALEQLQEQRVKQKYCI